MYNKSAEACHQAKLKEAAKKTIRGRRTYESLHSLGRLQTCSVRSQGSAQQFMSSCNH
jgi:hypothetical protein